MTVAEIVAAKCKNADVSPLVVAMAIDEASQCVKNYCNIDIIPTELDYTLANMACDIIRYQDAIDKKDAGLQQSGDTTIDPNSTVTSVKVGDTTVSLGENSNPAKSHAINMDSLIMSYREQLQKFRRMVW